MLSALKDPMNIALLAIIAFAIGMTIVLMKRRESFSEWNIPLTVVEFAQSPKQLSPVYKSPVITDHDYYYNQFGG